MSVTVGGWDEREERKSMEDRIKSLEDKVAILQALADNRRPFGTVKKPVMQPVEAILTDVGNDASIIREPTYKEKYRDRSLVIVCPTRGMVAVEVSDAWKSMAMPMNQKWNGPMFAKGYEVASAYNALIEGVLAHPFLKTWKFILTIEDDNVPPFDAILRLFETLEAGPNGDGSSEWDAVSGIYFTKDSVHSPMAYGSAEEYRKTGHAYYYPVNIGNVPHCAKYPCEDTSCLNHVLEVNGIAQGCALWKMEIFKEVKAHEGEVGFRTINDKILVDGKLLRPDQVDPMINMEPGKDYKKLCTQDLAFCEKIIHAPYNKRLAVDIRVAVGHLDVNTGRMY